MQFARGWGPGPVCPVCLLVLSLVRMSFPCHDLDLVEDKDSTRTIFRERERARTHTHHIFYRKHTHAIYFTGEETLHKHSYAQYTPPSLIADTACKVRAPHLRQPLGYFVCDGLKGMWPSSITAITAVFPLQLRRSKAQQRSMIRTKQSMYISTYTPYILQRARTHTHTHTIYFTESHIFYRRGDNAQNIPRRTYTPQSSTANTACKVRASPSSITAAFPLQLRRSRASANVRHGLTSCAAIDDSRKVEYTHRQDTLHYTLHRNLNLCNER